MSMKRTCAISDRCFAASRSGINRHCNQPAFCASTSFFSLSNHEGHEEHEEVAAVHRTAMAIEVSHAALRQTNSGNIIGALAGRVNRPYLLISAQSAPSGATHSTE